MNSLRPTPLPLHAPLEVVELAELHRREGCAAYYARLSRAADEGWPSFSCLACRAYSARRGAHELRLPIARIGDGRCPPARTVVDGVVVRRLDLVKLAQRELADLGPDRWPPVFVRGEVGDDGRLTQFSSWFRLQAMRRLGAEEVRAIAVAMARCPLCASRMLLADAVRRSGYCPECRRFLVPRGMRLDGLEARDKGFESERRRRMVRRRAPRGATVLGRAGRVISAVASTVLEQIELWEVE